MGVSMSGYGEESAVAALDVAALHRLVEVLIEQGYRVVGPTLRDNAIVLDELESAAELPCGWGVEVAPGHYRLRRRDDDAAFGHSSGPQAAIEADLARMVSDNLELEDAELTALCEKVIRSYDPCISCSAHFLTLTVHQV